MNTNAMNNMFGKVAPDMCKLSMNGGIAVKTSNGYKTYNINTGRLTNCANFVFPGGDDFFFVMPTTKVQVGDILMVANKPKCVIEVKKNMITVINYEDSTVENILPERHMFMGNMYMYRKIVSLFGNDLTKGKAGANKIMKYMMLSEMMKGGNSANQGGMSAMLPFMMMNGGMGGFFDGMFDFDDDDTEEDNIVDTEEE